MENTRTRIESELERAREALRADNPGMARVCCRRAAGEAIGAFARAHPDRDYGQSAVARLERFAADASIPEHVRRAASRLRAGLGPDETREVTEDPLGDADAIWTFIESGIGPPDNRQSNE